MNSIAFLLKSECLDYRTNFKGYFFCVSSLEGI